MWTLLDRNPRLLALILLLIVVGGLTSFQSLPRKEDPTLTQRFGLVLTRFPGASAEQMENQVTEKLEEGLSEVEEIKSINSVSRLGISVINLDLDEAVIEVDPVWSRVRDKLSDVALEFPSGVQNPQLELKATNVDAYSLIVALVWKGDSRPPMGILGRYAEELEDRLQAVPGTHQTSLFGQPREQIEIEFSLDDLAALGLSIPELARRIESADSGLPSGELESATQQLRIGVSGEFEKLDQIRGVPLSQGPSGEVLPLSHFAVVRKGVEDPPREIALINGIQGTVVSARVETDYRIDAWAKQAREEVRAIGEQLPPNVEMLTIFDQSEYVEQRISGLLTNLAIGCLAVILVTCLMMGWRSALLVAVALPLTCLSVFFGLNLLGIPLHQMSITGLVIALGLLIDNAIVVVDEVLRELRSGSRQREALASAASHLAIPLVGSTLTTAFAFAPLAIMPGPAGEFVGSIAVSVILSLFSSLVISLTIVATLAARFGKFQESTRFWQVGLDWPLVSHAFDRLLHWLLRRPAIAVLSSLALPALGLLAFSQLPEQFFPSADRKEFEIQVRLPSQTAIDQTSSIALAMRKKILANPEVAEVHWFVGASAPKFYYNMLGAQDDTPSYAQALVRFKSLGSEIPEVISRIQSDLQQSFPEAEVISRQFGQGPPVNAPIELYLYGPDLGELWQLGEGFRRDLTAIPEVITARSQMDPGVPMLRFEVNQEEAYAAGLTSTNIAGSLRAALEGTVGGSLDDGPEDLPVRIRLSPESRTRLEEISSLQVHSGSSAALLDSLGRFQLDPEISSISRREGKRVNVIQAFLSPEVLPSEVLAEYRSRVTDRLESLPPGYSYEFGGDSKERGEAINQLLAPLGILMVLLVATLVLSLNSFRLAGMIVAVAGSSLGLAFLSLWVFGFPFGFMAIVGAMGLVGVSVNDSIVVTAAIRRESKNRPDVESILRGVRTSARHVLTTTVTTVAGFMPLIVDGGRFWPPLAIAIAGGIVGSTLLALVFVPACHRLIFARGARKSMELPCPVEI